MKETKTNAMRLLDLASIPYLPHEYDPEKALSAVEVAKILSQDTERVFKTLVTVGKSLEHYLFVIPGEKELKESRQSLRREKYRDDSAKRASPSNWIYPRRMLSYRDKKEIENLFR